MLPDYDPDAAPSPPPLSPLPPMSHSEASWHAHTAGLRATPGQADASAPARQLAAAAAGGTTVCGIVFPPLSAGCLLAIQGAARLASEAGRHLAGAEEVAVLVYCLARGERAFALTEAGDLRALVAEARALLAPVPLLDLPQLTQFAAASVAQATGTPEKKTGL